MKNLWELLEWITRFCILLMIWYIGGFMLGACIVYLFHWLGLI